MTDSANLRIQQQINEAVAERGKMLAAQTKLIADQTELALAFCKAMKCEGIDEAAERVSEIRSGLEAAAAAAKENKNSVDEMTESMKKGAEEAQRSASLQKEMKETLTKVLSTASALGEVFKNSFEKGINGVRAMGSLVQSVVTGVLNIGKAMIMIPLKIFDAMMDKAAEVASASYAIAEAIEEVREQFGDPARGLSKEVVAGGKEMGESLSEAGLSIASVFGRGPEGVAKAIGESLEIAKSLGPALTLLGKNFGSAAGDLVKFKKGLGLSNEDLKAMISQSKSMGINFKTDFMKVSKIAKDMGSKFASLGISSKDIARDMAYLTTSSGKFGRVSKEAMAAASVTVRSYGLELKDVVGVLDQFADFESAATNASKFAQSFGTILDPIKLMKEENPAKAFEYLRQQMLSAGNSAETMNKAQIKQLATLSGMDENTVRLAFSTKNMGKSYEQIQKEADKSSKKQKTQQEIMQDLGKDIKRVVEAIQHSGSLLSEFFSGFGEGISRSEKGRKVLYDLAALLRGMRHLGREVGRVFTEAFPGVGKMFEGLHEALSGKDGIGNLVGKLRDSFNDLFGALKTNPADAIKKFYSSIQEIFTGTGGLSLMSEGFSEFKSAVSGIFAGLLEVMIESLTTGLDELAKIIADPSEYLASAQGFADSFFAPIVASLEKSLPKLYDSLKNLLITALVTYGPTIAMAMGAVFATYFGTALAFGMLNVAVTTGFSIFMKALGEMLLSALVATAATPPPGATSRINIFVAELKTVLTSLETITKSQLLKGAAIIGIITVTVVAAIAGLTYGLIYLAKEAAKVPENGIANVTKLLTMSMLMVAEAAAIALAGGLAGASIKFLAAGLGLAIVAIGVIGLFVGAMYGFVKLVPDDMPMAMSQAAESFKSMNVFMLELLKFTGMVAGIATSLAIAVVGVGVAFAALRALGVMLLTAVVTFPILAAGFAALATVSSGISEVMPAIVGHVENIVNQINAINFEPQKLVAFTTLLVGMLGTVASLMAGGVIATLTAPFSLSGLSIIRSYLDTISKEIPPIIQSLLSTVGNIEPAQLDSRVAAVTGIIESIVGLMEPLSLAQKIMDTAKVESGFHSEKNTARDVSEVFEGARGFVSGMASSAKTLVADMITLVKDVPDEQIKKVSVATQLMGALAGVLKPITSVASDLMGSSAGSGPRPNQSGVKKMLEWSVGFIKTLIDTNLKDMFTGILTITNLIPSKGLGVLEKKFKIVSDSFGFIGTAVDMFSKFSNPVDFTNLVVGVHNSKGVFDKLKTAFEPGGSYVSLLTTLEGMQSFSSKKIGAVDTGLSSVLSIATKIGQLGPKVETINEAYGGAIFDTLTAAVGDLDALNELLSDLKINDIDVTIDDLASKFHINKKEITVDSKPINIHMNLVVNFDALKFTNSVFTVASNAARMEQGDFNRLSDRARKDAEALQGLAKSFVN